MFSLSSTYKMIGVLVLCRTLFEYFSRCLVYCLVDLVGFVCRRVLNLKWSGEGFSFKIENESFIDLGENRSY